MNTRRGYVVLIRHGDPEISAGIAEGMMKATLSAPAGGDPIRPCGELLQGGEARGRRDGLTEEQVEVVEAEIDRQRIQRALLRVAVGNTNTAEDYAAMLTKARGDYAVTRRPGPLGRLGEQLLKLYALAVLAVSAAYRAQDLVLGRR